MQEAAIKKSVNKKQEEMFQTQELGLQQQCLENLLTLVSQDDISLATDQSKRRLQPQ
jgi:hypothetical protein